MKFCVFFILLFFLSSCLTPPKRIQKAEDHHEIAVALIRECDNPRALSHLLKAIRFNPRSFLIRHTLGAVYYSMGRKDKAMVEFKKILKRKSDFTEARVNLARVYIDQNQNNLALKELKKAEEDMTYTNYLKLVSQKGLAYYKKGSYPMAKKFLEEILSLPNGKSCFSYLHLGQTEMKLGNLKRSEQLLKKAVSFCSKETALCERAPNYQEHLALAELYIIKKDKKKAKYHLNLFLQKAIKTDSEMEKVRQLKESLN